MISNKNTKSKPSTLIQKMMKNKLLTLMIFAYSALIFLQPELGTSAVVIAKDNILQLLMVMPIILAMTSLTKAWIPEKLISEKLGADSGMIGTLLAFVLGSVSAGPIYAAFPFAKALLDKGASLRNITILLSSWAVIKVPMLANEMAFLGTKFMITRWILTVLAILLLSLILEHIVKRDDVLDNATPDDQESSIQLSTDSLNISQDCSGCAVCQKILPDDLKHIIRVEKGQAYLESGHLLPQNLFFQLQKVCPKKAIL